VTTEGKTFLKTAEDVIDTSTDMGNNEMVFFTFST
jgi:hypothetical protein